MYRLAIGRRHMETTQARAERYRQAAARVREDAYKARNPSTRQALLDNATQYESLAASLDRMTALDSRQFQTES